MLSMMDYAIQLFSDKTPFIVSSGSKLRYVDRYSDRRLLRPALRRRGFEHLEDRSLKATGDLRVVSYNIRSFSGVPCSEMGTVLQAIRSESVGCLARPIDLLAIQESRTQATATSAVVSQLNSIYGAGTYSRGSVNGNSGGGLQIVGVVFHTQSIQLFRSRR